MSVATSHFCSSLMFGSMANTIISDMFANIRTTGHSGKSPGLLNCANWHYATHGINVRLWLKCIMQQIMLVKSFMIQHNSPLRKQLLCCFKDFITNFDHQLTEDFFWMDRKVFLSFKNSFKFISATWVEKNLIWIEAVPEKKRWLTSIIIAVTTHFGISVLSSF